MGVLFNDWLNAYANNCAFMVIPSFVFSDNKCTKHFTSTQLTEPNKEEMKDRDQLN